MLSSVAGPSVRSVIASAIAALVLGCKCLGDGGHGRSSADCATPPVETAPLLTHSGVHHVVLVSVDGLAVRYLRRLLRANRVPAFARLAQQGVSTNNARTDPSNTYTLPNHVSMLTGLPVVAPPCANAERGHGYTSNDDPDTRETIHDGNQARRYTPSVFDVVHDRGLSTALFASKSKFSILTNSYNDSGAPDQLGEDDGPRKIDHVFVSEDLGELTEALTSALVKGPPSFSFVHFGQPDRAGHADGWGSAEYLDAIVAVDAALGRILTLIEGDPRLAAHVALILTADHGGSGSRHWDAGDADNFTIPFFVLGPELPAGRDLYAFVGARRRAPNVAKNPGLDDPAQPIRNGDAGNLALSLLGLPPIPGSWMGAAAAP